MSDIPPDRPWQFHVEGHILAIDPDNGRVLVQPKKRWWRRKPKPRWVEGVRH